MLKLIQKRLASNNVENEQENNRLNTRFIETIPAVFQLENQTISYTGVTGDISLNSDYLQSEDTINVKNSEEGLLFSGYEISELQSSVTRSDIFGIALCIYNDKVTLSQFLTNK
jgi:hypothetical protein